MKTAKKKVATKFFWSAAVLFARGVIHTFLLVDNM